MQETAQQPILIKRRTSVSKKRFNGYQIAARPNHRNHTSVTNSLKAKAQLSFLRDQENVPHTGRK
jgi:hypothetical protein